MGGDTGYSVMGEGLDRKLVTDNRKLTPLRSICMMDAIRFLFSETQSVCVGSVIDTTGRLMARLDALLSTANRRLRIGRLTAAPYRHAVDGRDLFAAFLYLGHGRLPVA